MGFRLDNKSFVFFSALFLLVFIGCFPSFVHADQSSASSELASANNNLVQCLNAAKAAEQAGANITALTGTLDEAGSTYSQAELAYSVGNFPDAYTLALHSQNELSNFISTANSLQNAALQKQNTDFLLNFVGPIIGAVAVIVGSVAIWISLNRRNKRGE